MVIEIMLKNKQTAECVIMEAEGRECFNGSSKECHVVQRLMTIRFKNRNLSETMMRVASVEW